MLLNVAPVITRLGFIIGMFGFHPVTFDISDDESGPSFLGEVNTIFA